MSQFPEDPENVASQMDPLYTMSVGDLKHALKGVPDDYPVAIQCAPGVTGWMNGLEIIKKGRINEQFVCVLQATEETLHSEEDQAEVL